MPGLKRDAEQLPTVALRDREDRPWKKTKSCEGPRSTNRSTAATLETAFSQVDRTYHDANHNALFAGAPLPVRLRRSRAVKGREMNGPLPPAAPSRHPKSARPTGGSAGQPPRRSSAWPGSPGQSVTAICASWPKSTGRPDGMLTRSRCRSTASRSWPHWSCWPTARVAPVRLAAVGRARHRHGRQPGRQCRHRRSGHHQPPHRRLARPGPADRRQAPVRHARPRHRAPSRAPRCHAVPRARKRHRQRRWHSALAGCPRTVRLGHHLHPASRRADAGSIPGCPRYGHGLAPRRRNGSNHGQARPPASSAAGPAAARRTAKALGLAVDLGERNGSS